MIITPLGILPLLSVAPVFPCPNDISTLSTTSKGRGMVRCHLHVGSAALSSPDPLFLNGICFPLASSPSFQPLFLFFSLSFFLESQFSPLQNHTHQVSYLFSGVSSHPTPLTEQSVRTRDARETRNITSQISSMSKTGRTRS